MTIKPNIWLPKIAPLIQYYYCNFVSIFESNVYIDDYNSKNAN